MDLPTSNKKRKAEPNPNANPKKKTKNKEKRTKNIESSSISNRINKFKFSKNEFKVNNEVEKEISNIFNCKDEDLVSKSKDQRILIKGEDIKRLKDTFWLNDEVFFFYLFTFF